MNKKKKIVLLLAFLSLFLFIYESVTTYAKYFTETTGSIGSNIKKWDIKVNNESIKNGEKLNKEIEAYFEESQHIAENQMAPGSEGYFIISLNYSNVDLSFQYDISIEENDKVKDINIYKLEVDGTEVTTTDGNLISNTIDINDPTDLDKIQEIKVYIRWNDNEEDGAIMDDNEDTNIAIENETINFNINIGLTQLAN